MGLFRSAEEKAAAKVRKEEAKFLGSPTGRAATALAQGERLFQIDLAVDAEGSRALSEIESIGWRLESASYAYELHLSSVSNSNDQLSSISSSGRLVGVYLFRPA